MCELTEPSESHQRRALTPNALPERICPSCTSTLVVQVASRICLEFGPFTSSTSARRYCCCLSRIDRGETQATWTVPVDLAIYTRIIRPLAAINLSRLLLTAAEPFLMRASATKCCEVSFWFRGQTTAIMSFVPAFLSSSFMALCSMSRPI